MLPPPDVPEHDALCRAAEVHASGQWHGSETALHVAICTYVRAVRGRGASAESTLVAVRTAVGEAAGQPFRSGEHRSVRAGENDWVARAVTCCIEEYYRPA